MRIAAAASCLMGRFVLTSPQPRVTSMAAGTVPRSEGSTPNSLWGALWLGRSVGETEGWMSTKVMVRAETCVREGIEAVLVVLWCQCWRIMTLRHFQDCR
nr:hypothetical protein CFP56_60270 [Quercus suber]